MENRIHSRGADAFIEEVESVIDEQGLEVDEDIMELLEELEEVNMIMADAIMDSIRHKLFMQFNLILND